MNIGDRIKARREELGLSQDELAKRMGYTSRSTINKVEKNINDVTQSNVVKYAKALETTPSYLMGWEDVPLNVHVDYMNEDIAHQIVKMRQEGLPLDIISELLRLSPAKREIVMNLVHSLLLDEHPSQEHEDSQ